MTPATESVTLTPRAADKLREVFSVQEAVPEDAGLRVGVYHGGCSGFQYQLALDRETDGDSVFTHDELRILVDADSLPFVAGSAIEFVEDADRAGFVVDNPRAVRGCGCGSSFVMREDAAVQGVSR